MKILVQRIIGALTFNSQVYKDVEHDTSFTPTAWMIVVVSAFLNQLGGNAYHGFGEIGKWAIGTVGYTITSVIAFALGALVMSWLAKAIFNAEVTFEEVVRTVGLAYIWTAFGVIGIVGGIFLPLACLLAPIGFLAAILGLAASFIALKEAVDLDVVQTLVVVVVGFVINLVFGAIMGIILGIFGFGSAMLSGAFNV